MLDGERGVDTVLGMAARLAGLAPRAVTVFGPRCSVRPLLGQADDGTWQVEPESVEHDDNAIDALVRLAPRRRSSRPQGSRAARKKLADVLEARLEHLVVERVAAEHAAQERRRRRSSRGWRRVPVRISCSLSCLRKRPSPISRSKNADGPVEEAA